MLKSFATTIAILGFFTTAHADCLIEYSLAHAQAQADFQKINPDSFIKRNFNQVFKHQKYVTAKNNEDKLRQLKNWAQVANQQGPVELLLAENGSAKGSEQSPYTQTGLMFYRVMKRYNIPITRDHLQLSLAVLKNLSRTKQICTAELIQRPNVDRVEAIFAAKMYEAHSQGLGTGTYQVYPLFQSNRPSFGLQGYPVYQGYQGYHPYPLGGGRY